MNNLHFGLLTLVCLMSASCVIPTPRHTPSGEWKINPKTLEFMHVGHTTKKEVLSNLKKPHKVVGNARAGMTVEEVRWAGMTVEEVTEWENDRYFLYQGFTVSGYWHIPAFPRGAGGVTGRKNFYLLIEFDDQGIVNSLVVEREDQGSVKRYGKGSRPWAENNRNP